MPAPKIVTRTLAEVIASNLSMKVDEVRKVLGELDRVTEQALVKGNEVEVGSYGYLSLRDPVKVKPIVGEIVRGKRVAFREKNANRHRWKL